MSFAAQALFLPIEHGVNGGFVELVFLGPFPDGNTDSGKACAGSLACLLCGVGVRHSSVSCDFV